jgi:hypothetical protein
MYLHRYDALAGQRRSTNEQITLSIVPCVSKPPSTYGYPYLERQKTNPQPRPGLETAPVDNESFPPPPQSSAPNTRRVFTRRPSGKQPCKNQSLALEGWNMPVSRHQGSSGRLRSRRQHLVHTEIASANIQHICLTMQGCPGSL